MKSLAALLVAAVFVLAVAACGGGNTSSGEEATTTEASGGASSGGGELEGEVGPGFEIEVKQNGEDAESVKAGTYTLKVEDKSSIHNFHLIGPGVDQVVTEVPSEGDKTVTVTLRKGTYTYQCDPHAAQGMRGTFEVT
jgi:plastocyanin